MKCVLLSIVLADAERRGTNVLSKILSVLSAVLIATVGEAWLNKAQAADPLGVLLRGMIEPVEPFMYFGIGFLLAGLIGLAFSSLIHNRAVRLTMRRLEGAIPFSTAEILADKDLLRAEFAISTRRLEMTVEQLRKKTASQLAELGKRADAINKHKIEYRAKNTEIVALRAQVAALRARVTGVKGDANPEYVVPLVPKDSPASGWERDPIVGPGRWATNVIFRDETSQWAGARPDAHHFASLVSASGLSGQADRGL